MLFLKGHGRHVVPDGTRSAPNYPAHTCVSEACGFTPEELILEDGEGYGGAASRWPLSLQRRFLKESNGPKTHFTR